MDAYSPHAYITNNKVYRVSNWEHVNSLFYSMTSILPTYSGDPNSQTRLIINALEKIPGVLSFVAIDIL